MAKTLRTLVLLGAMSGVPALASAQAGVEDTIVVEVPFDFIAGDKELPAGTYRVTVRPESEGEEPALVTLATAAQGETPEQMIFHSVSTKVVDVDDLSGLADQTLVFSKVGDLYFLDEVNVS